MGLFGGARERIALWWTGRWVKRARRGKEGEGAMRFVKWLDGNNRIVALALLLVVGAFQAFGIDVTQYVHVAMGFLHVSPDLPKELGLNLTLDQVTWAAYALFSCVRAIYKRRQGIPDAAAAAQIRG